jgi:hypothetical protein
MDWSQFGQWVGVAIVIAALILLPRFFSFRLRAIAGILLFAVGWAGIFVGVSLDEPPLMRSEAIAYTWVGLSTLAICLAIVLLVPLFFEWRRNRRRAKGTAERWTAGHWKN